MRTTLALLILGLTASSVMCDCPASNVYATLASITAANDGLVTSAAGTDVTAATKCGFTVTGTADKICMTQASVDTKIDAYITTLTGALEDAAEQRDQYIVDQRGEVIKVLDSLRRINELAGSNLAGFADTFATAADEITTNFTAFVEGFDTYRKARATCFNALIKSQVGLICTSLRDPLTSTVAGFDATGAGTTWSDAFALELSNACYSYLQNSEIQTSILLTSIYSSLISSIADYFDRISNNDITGAAEALASLVTAYGKVTVPSDNYKKPSQISDTTCTSATACGTWIEDNLFNDNAILEQDNAIFGGAVRTVSIVSSRVLSEGKERRLATGGFATTLASWSGFTVDFSETPGNVDNTKNANSALRNGIVACAVAALALVF